MGLTQMPISDYGVYWVTGVVDYHSRYVVTPGPSRSRTGCHFSPTHTAEDVIEAMEKALEEARQFYVIEESEAITLVSDNGPQFTSRRFREYLQSAPFRHVRARSHHPETLGMAERFHQSLKYEEIWPNDYEDPIEAQMRIAVYREHYTKGGRIRPLTTECLLRDTVRRPCGKWRGRKPDTLLSLKLSRFGEAGYITQFRTTNGNLFKQAVLPVGACPSLNNAARRC